MSMPNRKKRQIKISKKLPNQILFLPNEDKKFHEKWHEGRNLGDFPHPFRLCILGKVGLGKSNIAKNIFLRCQMGEDPFKQLYVIHGSKTTKEWDDVEPTMILSDIPEPDDLTDNDTKTMIIIDDFEMTKISKQALQNLSSLFRFISSHHNFSIIICYQSFFDMPPIVRKCCNIFIIYRPHNDDELVTIGRRVGLKKDEIIDIFDNLLPDSRDTLCVDTTIGSPAYLRKNIFEKIEKDTSTSDTD